MSKKNLRKIEKVGDGNTKSSPTRRPQPPQLMKWFFTFNNYEKEDINILTEKFQEICVKYCFQEEVGEKTGTPHLQGNIWLKKSMRWSEFGLSPKIQWKKTRNEEAAYRYCTKRETAIGVPYLYGFPKPIKTIEELYPWQKSIEDLFFTEPDGRTCNWYYDTEGGKGKSSFCKYMYIKHKAITIQGGKLADIMNIIFNLDMDIVNMLIIDVPRNNLNNVSYSAIECILNGMITNTKFETGVKVFNPPHVVIFSNYLPDRTKLSEDRWNIVELEN